MPPVAPMPLVCWPVSLPPFMGSSLQFLRDNNHHDSYKEGNTNETFSSCPPRSFQRCSSINGGGQWWAQSMCQEHFCVSGQYWQESLSLTKCQEGTSGNSADSGQLFWWYPQGMGSLQSETLPFSAISRSIYHGFDLCPKLKFLSYVYNKIWSGKSETLHSPDEVVHI